MWNAVEIDLSDASGVRTAESQSDLVVAFERYGRELERDVIVSEHVHLVAFVAGVPTAWTAVDEIPPGCGYVFQVTVREVIVPSVFGCFVKFRVIEIRIPVLSDVVGHQLREQVKSWTGLTMGVGIAPTKTLAKSAQWATKQWPQFSGVVALEAENRNWILKLLGLQPVGEVWGIGRRLTEKLNALGINTALQLAQANTAFIRKNFSVILERTVRELNGESCISLEEAPPAKQQIVCSRSFGERITDKDAMHQAVVQYAERAAEKLRGERQYCRQVTTFVRTSPFAVKEPCYSNAAVEKLPLPTQDSRDIIAAACRALNHVWREGYHYMKAGVMLADFTPSGIAQPGLFDEIQPRKNSEKLMKTLDELNQSGKGKVWFAGRGTAPEWQMKREMLSPSYTTQWTEIPIASF